MTFAVFSLCFTYINQFYLHKEPKSRYHYYHNSVDEESEVQRSETTSQGQTVSKLVLGSRHSGPSHNASPRCYASFLAKFEKIP